MYDRHLASDDDAEDIRKLWQYCFDDDENFVQWYFREYYQAENTLGLYDHGRLAAALQIIPYSIMMRQKSLSCGYVVGVSTAPQDRGQGLSGQMLVGALEIMRERGQVLSLLMPFAGEFYYRYQWQFAYFKQQVTLPLDKLRTLRKPYGRLVLTEAAKVLPELAKVYEAFCATRNGYVLRTPANWQHLLADLSLQQGFCVMLYHDATPEGYALYVKKGGDIQIVEMAYENFAARGGLLDYFYSHRSHCQNLIWKAPSDDPLPYELPDGQNVIHWRPDVMLRVVDVIGALSALCYPLEEKLTLRLKIMDKWAEWNNGIFRLAITDGQGVVEKLADDEWDVAMDVGALALLLSGASDCRQLAWRGLLQARQTENLGVCQRLWPQQDNWLSEEY